MSKIELSPAQDGVTHINISLNGKTELGRMLHPSYMLPVKHPELGEFKTHETFRQWLKSGRTSLRMPGMDPNEARQLASRMKTVRIPAEEYADLMCEALTSKIEFNPGLKKALLESAAKNLPFVSYTLKTVETSYPGETRTEVVDHTDLFEWMFFHLNILRHWDS